eukprot:CAMPEP_0203840398 /NCGR_PEP_ID=MMETSP0359-20131031/751_1 /ASSEMBLY_ACC=CAM_ASM_000338 /TAXON_ID=268821 /ORGANISM="Scrippsiella Hangoei, Strain SHTV-5" /LENGTH=328 /DNA_ID=CAMNT_0050754603 /DNA_START=86 /DNA_END=1072 /DNA_ORIENTATION=+
MSKGSCTVFIGNIPYDATEDDLKEVFGRAGPVDSMRMVYDKDTKQPKGYAFCDYADPDSAMRAIRELNDAECNGRQLRIDLADNALRGGKCGGGGKGFGGPAPMLALTAGALVCAVAVAAVAAAILPVGAEGAAAGAGAGGPELMGVVPVKQNGPPGHQPDVVMGDAFAAVGSTPEEVIAAVNAHAEIAQTIASMPQAQLQLCLGAMQRLAVEAPENTRAFLQDNPQLAYALLHAQLLLGLTLEPALPPDDEEIRRLRAESVRRPTLASIQASAGRLVHPNLPGMIGGPRVVPPAGFPGGAGGVRPGFAPTVGLAPKAASPFGVPMVL